MFKLTVPLLIASKRLYMLALLASLGTLANEMYVLTNCNVRRREPGMSKTPCLSLMTRALINQQLSLLTSFLKNGMQSYQDPSA